MEIQTVAKFIVPDWGILLTPAWGCRDGLTAYVVAWRAVTTNTEVLDDNPMLVLTLSPQSGTMNWATDVGGGALKQTKSEMKNVVFFIFVLFCDINV